MSNETVERAHEEYRAALVDYDKAWAEQEEVRKQLEHLEELARVARETMLEKQEVLSLEVLFLARHRD